MTPAGWRPPGRASILPFEIRPDIPCRDLTDGRRTSAPVLLSPTIWRWIMNPFDPFATAAFDGYRMPDENPPIIITGGTPQAQNTIALPPDADPPIVVTGG